MDGIIQINAEFIENSSSYIELVSELRKAFASQDTIVPTRHHHDLPNPTVSSDTTLLLMPAWRPSEDGGVKIVTVSPKNESFELPAVNGIYIYMDALKGTVRAILEAKSLTAKRTAASSALASSFLSRTNASSLLMLGTGALSTNLIKAHTAVRPIQKVFVWGRNFEKAKAICQQLEGEKYEVIPLQNKEEKMSEVDIISCATLSKTPLIFGKNLRAGQHLDLVGSYRKDMREADDETILRSTVYLDSYGGGMEENGDIYIPLQKGILKETDIRADLFDLCSKENLGRKTEHEITLFKSVGHALEDLTAATYYYKKFVND